MNESMDKLVRELEIRNFSNKTVKSYTYAVENFLKYAQNKEMNEDSVKDYIQILIKKQNPSTVSSNLSAIEFFFEKVLNKKIKLPHPKRNKPIPEVLTAEEVKNLINSIHNYKHKLILKLLYGCGLRVSELVSLKKEDINFTESLIHIKLSKGRKDRFVKIPESIKEDLHKYLDLTLTNLVFESAKGGKLNTATIQKIVKDSAKKAGIKKNVYSHAFRHAFGTHSIQDGEDIVSLQEMMGHSSLDTTRLYITLSKKHVRGKKTPLDRLEE